MKNVISYILNKNEKIRNQTRRLRWSLSNDKGWAYERRPNFQKWQTCFKKKIRSSKVGIREIRVC